MSSCYGKRLTAVLLSLVIGCWGCSPDSGGDTICDPLAPECADGLVCESVAGGESQCVGPLVIRGRVLNIADEEPIADARVQAVDANGAAVGTSAATDSDGAYELIVPANRDADLTPLSGSYTLRAQAASFIEFPTAIRPALPLDAATAVAEDDGWIIENTLTTIKLIALPGDTSDLGSISGTIAGQTNAGLLLVAENADTALTGFSDSEGAYIIFNVPAGTYSVQGYAAGVQLDAVSTSVQVGEDQIGIDLTESDRPLNTVSGSVQIVNAPGGSVTSVILAVESTFVEAAGRGTVPPGLRVGDIEGAFLIEEVPDGSYVVLAAFENDGLVRDPDQSIGGTQIVRIEVPDPDQGNVLSISEGFKVTGALAVVSPGPSGPEEVDTTTPVFEWEDDSSEDGYEIRVFDSFGDQIWSDEIASISGAETVSHTYAGPPLEIGMFYQFRATSFRERNGPRTAISTTEDLKGVFFYLGDAPAAP